MGTSKAKTKDSHAVSSLFLPSFLRPIHSRLALSRDNLTEGTRGIKSSYCSYLANYTCTQSIEINIYQLIFELLESKDLLKDI
jgi:hypothetical protein